MAGFVHLHVHTEYSLRQGALRISDLIQRCVQEGMHAVAVTDTNALYGAVQFYKAAKSAGVQPILGVQLSLARDEEAENFARHRPVPGALDTAVFLAESLEGYRNLVRLVTVAQRRTANPFITVSELYQHRQELIALIAGGESTILRSFSSGASAAALGWLSLWRETMSDNCLYIDVQDHGIPEERKGLPALIQYARQQNMKLAATNDVHYLQREDAPAQKVLAQLEGHTDAKPLPADTYEFASEAEMQRRFSKLPEAIANTLEIAERCRVELPLGQTLLPTYPISDRENSSQVLRRAAEFGARQRYGQVTEPVQQRLDYELSIIEGLGFSDYFLVVADFIRFAHKKGISTGPGRGSAAGSLVAYALRITDVDPLRNHLFFERFLNPERVSWPDIDTDFEFERRGEVIQYVVERYGIDHVAQIGTFGTLAAKAALRDAGRALKIESALVDRIARMIPSQPGITLEQAKKDVSGIDELIRAYPQVASLWEAACAIEGFPRHTSVHAAGVVISPVPLADWVPVQMGGDGTPVTQYAMEDIEAIGLMKMDFLGLKTLTLIDRTLESLERRTGQKLDWKSVSEQDKRTFDMLSKGETEGCFQLESAGVRRVLRDLRPTGLEDLIAVISLYRPGPMENIPTFIQAKHGRIPVQYPHPDLKPILQDTYGVIVYQEQIMQIAAVMAGFTLGQADLLRRAVSKKKRDVLDAERSRFVAGCLSKGYAEQVANNVYDLIVRFADYGFNRSHAAAYAILAFRTAYLRANHMPDFLASLLTMVMGDDVKTKEYTRIAKQHGITVQTASVVSSTGVYQAESDHSIRQGLLGIRNVGRMAVDAIVTARSERPFESLVDFLQRVPSRACNRKAVESLLDAGALQSFLPDAVSTEAARDILEEAYRSVEDGRAVGLGLQFGGGSNQPVSKVSKPSILYLRYSAKQLGTEGQKQIRGMLQRYPGDIPVALLNRDTQKVRLLGPQWKVQWDVNLQTELEELLGLGNARLGHSPRHNSKE